MTTDKDLYDIVYKNMNPKAYKLEKENEKLKQQNKRMIEMLKLLEWDRDDVCSYCHRLDGGHSDDCELNKLLREVKGYDNK